MLRQKWNKIPDTGKNISERWIFDMTDFLIECRNIKPDGTNNAIDLNSTKVNTSLPVYERINSFVSQTKNPYLFCVDGIEVKLEFTGGSGLTDLMGKVLSA